MRRIRDIAVCLLFVAASSCDKTGRSQGPIVAFVAPTLANPFFVQMREGAQQAADSAGLELIFQAPPGGVEDAAAQIDLVQTILTRRPVALCLVPADSRGIIPAVQTANRLGIPVINIDNRIDSGAAAAAQIELASFFGSDNRLGGRLAGEYIVRRLNGRGRVALLEGLSGSDAAIQRASGFRDALATTPGIQLVATESASWSREQGLNKFLGMLQSNPDLDAVFAANDEMALGAIAALQERGTQRQRDHIAIVGFDATPDGINAIDAGQMSATIAQQPREMGKLCIQAAARLVAGEVIPTAQSVPVILRTRDSTAHPDSAKLRR